MSNEQAYRKALEEIVAIENQYSGPDWEEIDKAREIASTALAAPVAPTVPLGQSAAPQAGTWTLIAPDGRQWQAEHPLRTVALERNERVCPTVQLERILRVADEPWHTCEETSECEACDADAKLGKLEAAPVAKALTDEQPEEWKVVVESQRLYAPILKAAINLLFVIDERHDSLSSPFKYGVPYYAVNALRAAIEGVPPLAASTQAVPDGWRPIETAPKDGSLIVLGAKHGVWLGKYVPVYTSGYIPDNPWSSMMLNHDHIAERYTRPTHWTPLPTPPADKGEPA